MIVHYLDPSAWIKRHFQEAGSDAVNELFRSAETIACCRLGLVEMIATVARKSRVASLESSVSNEIVQNIQADFAAFAVSAFGEDLIENATELAAKHGLRTMDAIHLAAALSHRPAATDVILVSSDLELLTAAANEGLTTLNPAA